MGLGGLLRERSGDLTGILNGIDSSVWDPATDPHIPGCFYTDVSSGFESEVLQNRATNKAALQRRLGLQLAPDVLMLGVIGTLSIILVVLEFWNSARARKVPAGDGEN